HHPRYSNLSLHDALPISLFERSDAPGGLLMYGIPDFKLDKQVILHRVEQMRAEGVEFRCGVEVGKDLPAEQLLNEYEAVLLTVGDRKSTRLNSSHVKISY